MKQKIIMSIFSILLIQSSVFALTNQEIAAEIQQNIAQRCHISDFNQSDIVADVLNVEVFEPNIQEFHSDLDMTSFEHRDSNYNPLDHGFIYQATVETSFGTAPISDQNKRVFNIYYHPTEDAAHAIYIKMNFIDGGEDIQNGAGMLLAKN